MIPKLSSAVDVMDMDPLPSLKACKEYDHEVYPVVEFNPPQKYLEELVVSFATFFLTLYN